MKKIISIVLALMMVLSMTTSAFAGTTYPDVDAKNKVLTDAIGLLSGLKIINGFPDGTFKPERTVTRAQMAKMLVIALGYANVPGGEAKYKDVPKDYWGVNEIAWATDLGIITGYPDGTFKPENTVSYTHAMVMILRALGYNNSSLNGGKSDEYIEANYKKRALEMRLFDDLSSVTGGANRGDVAIMIRSALNQYKVEDGPTGKWQIVTDYDEKGNQIKKMLISDVAKKATITVTDEVVTKNNNIDLSGYMYQTISVYTDETGRIIYVEGSQNTVGELSDNSKSDAVVSVNGTKHTLAYDKTKVKVSFNGVETTKNLNEIPVGAKVILSGEAGKYSIVGIIYEGVNDIDVITKAYKTGDKKIGNISLPVKSGKVDLTGVVVTGDANSLEDIEVDDVIQVCRADGGSKVKIYVTRNSVNGTVEKRSSDKQEVTINGVAYKFTGYTASSGTAPVTYVKVGVSFKGTFLLDMTGKIAYVKGETTPVATNEYYGFVSALQNGEKTSQSLDGIAVKTYPKMRVYGVDGRYNDYEIAVTLNADGTINSKAENININNNLEIVGLNDGLLNTDSSTVVISYTLDANKRITKVDIQSLKSETQKVTSAYFFADATTPMVVKASSKSYKAVTKSDLRTDTAITFQYIGDVKGWKLVVLPSSALKGSTVVQTSKYAVITSVSEAVNKAGDVGYEVTMLVDGAEVAYTTDKNFTITSGLGTSKEPKVSSTEVYTYALNGNGDLISMTYKTGKTLSVESSDSKYIVSGGDRYTFSDTVTICKVVDGKIVLGSTGDFEVGKTVVVFQDADDYVQVVIIQ